MAKAFPGQPWRPPSASQQNRWDESAEFFALKKRLRDKLPDQRMPVPTEMDVIKVQNSTGGDREESEVVELGAEIIDEPTRLHPWLDAVKPTSRCCRYGVLRYPTKATEIRWCQVSGPTFALVDLTLGHKRCSPKKDTFHFVGDDDGPIEILWKPDEESGVHECIVELEQVVPPSTYVARIPEAGIPARIGTLLGRSVCKIYKLYPHDYTEPEVKTLEPILKPDGSILTKEIYNTSLRAVKACGDVLYIPVHREECGNWIVSDSVARNTWYLAELVDALCPDNRGEVAITNVEPVEAPEHADVTAQITTAINRFGRAALPGYLVLIMRKFRTTSSGSGSGSGSSGDAGCEDDFLVVQVLATCRDVPVALETSCVESGSESGILIGSAEEGDGRFLFREDCDSGAESGASGVASATSCAPIRASVQRKVAIETCTEDPELIDQLQLEMQDVVVNLSMDGCPTWVNAVVCVFGSCFTEVPETAECEPVCPEGSDSGS